MNKKINEHLQKILDKKRANNAFRSLKIETGLVDFCSNDYLGFAKEERLQNSIQLALQKQVQKSRVGATGSRLLTGNYIEIETLEKQIANFHKTEAALLFNSGYDANAGIYPTLARKGDTIFYDELSHASTLDGLKLSKATAISFKHNDVNDLKRQLKLASGNCWLSIESVYSMNGTIAPLADFVSLAKKHPLNIIVDEAHATGVLGKKGEGLVQAMGLEEEVFARIHTFGKALGVQGAAVVGPQVLREYLINFCRTFIFTTAPTIYNVIAIQTAYELLAQSPHLIGQLQQLIAYFKQQAQALKLLGLGLLTSNTPIQGIVVSGNTAVRQLALQIQNAGFDVRPIISPTVAKGKERIRICLHAFNTHEEIDELIGAFQK